MKKLHAVLQVVMFVLSLAILVAPSSAAALGRATAPFDNARPDRGETAWGRLVADALRSAGQADIALINAASLRKGTLGAGDITDAKVNALLAFPGDDVVTITITGAQLRAALERAVQAYPTGSAAFLQGSGFTAQFNTQASTNERLTLLRIGGREVRDDDKIRAAMPQPLAQGGSGYFTIWNADGATRAGTSVAGAIAQYIRARGEVSPDNAPRLSAQ
jgi:2',3'-cyclic-nucleotide 2'-phosphodiesterase (5'-nucleotidase family)